MVIERRLKMQVYIMLKEFNDEEDPRNEDSMGHSSTYHELQIELQIW